jgi:hypothetical protein
MKNIVKELLMTLFYDFKKIIGTIFVFTGQDIYSHPFCFGDEQRLMTIQQSKVMN